MVRLRVGLGGLLLLEGDEADGEYDTASFDRRLRAIFDKGGAFPLVLPVGVAGASVADPSLKTERGVS